MKYMFKVPAFLINLVLVALFGTSLAHAQPTISAGAFTSSGFQFTVSGTSGAQVNVLASSDMVNWTTLAQVTLNNGSYNFVDTAAPTMANRFYIASAGGGACPGNCYGFFTTTIPAGGSMLLADQFINAGGNTLPLLFPNPPSGLTIDKWDLSAQNFVVAFYSTRGGWTPNAATMTLNPGEGALVQNPLSTGLPVTFIGNVPQGIQVNAGVPTGAGQTAFLSSIVPESAGLDVLGFQPASGDVVYRYNPALHQYSPPYTYNGTSWSPSVPAMNVGEGFYFIRGAASSVSWTENITACPPSASVTAPFGTEFYVAPASINITASASGNTGISSVKFYQGATLIGTVTTSPYAFTWNNVPTGTYSLTAMATDNNGVTTISTPVSETVMPFADTLDLTLPLTAQVQVSPPQITLSFGGYPGTMPAGYTSFTTSIYRKPKGAAGLGTLLASGLTGSSYVDADPNAIQVGAAYEYQVIQTFTGPNVPTGPGLGNRIFAGIQVPLVDQRGKIILLVDNTVSTALASKLSRLQADLTGDGWTVLRHDVNRGPEPRAHDISGDSNPYGTFNSLWAAANAQGVKEIKAVIQADYATDPGNVKAVFLFGHIAVPYTGDVVPDGHIQRHQGAWPSDAFYGNVTSPYGVTGWTDVTVNDAGAERAENYNVPGDGKFDQSSSPAPTTLEVGRVDLYNMTKFALGETDLLSQYLDKDHNFRNKNFTVKQQALVGTAQSALGQIAVPFDFRFAADWNSKTAMFGNQVIVPDPSGYMQWFPFLNQAQNSYLWASGSGDGGYYDAYSVGGSYYGYLGGDCPECYGYFNPPRPIYHDFADTPSYAVFTSLFGSFFGDWDNDNNFLRAPLANSGYGLSCLWINCNVAPHLRGESQFMGLGETIGYVWLRTIQYGEADFNQILAGGHPGLDGTSFFGLMGDPTLRLHIIAPPSQLSVNNANSANPVSVTWTRSLEDTGDSGNGFWGYNIYRAVSPAGPFSLLNSSGPVNDMNFLDTQLSYQAPADPNGLYKAYMVKAVKLESSPSGTYFNGSEGIIQTVSGTIAPQILNGPANLIVTIGSIQGVPANFVTPAAFTVYASGTGPLSYQWSKDGQVLAGQTAAQLIVSQPQQSDVGTYTVTVSNGGGQASASATLSINQAPQVQNFTMPPLNLTPQIISGGIDINNILSVDSDLDQFPNSALSIISVTGFDSRAGTISINSGGQSLHYVPNSSWYGPTVFQCLVTDGAAFARQTVTINVILGGDFAVPIHGQPGETVEILATTDFNTWTSLGTLALAGTSANFTDTQALSLYQYRFYSIRHANSFDSWGFIKVTAVGRKPDGTGGQTEIANQLVNPSGNSVQLIFPNVPNGTTVNIWKGLLNPSGFYGAIFSLGIGWGHNGSITLGPGEGAFIYNPLIGQDIPLLFVGSVIGTPQANTGLPSSAGQPVLSSILPVSASLDSLNFPAISGDAIYFWDTVQQSYGTQPYTFDGTSWSRSGTPSVPTPQVGQPFSLVRSGTASNPAWTENLANYKLTPPVPVLSGGTYSSGSGFTFNITGPVGATVTVYGTQDFNQSWSNLGQVTLTGGTGAFPDASAASMSYRFYAVTEGPVPSANTYGFFTTTIPAGGSMLLADQFINAGGNTLPLLFPNPPSGLTIDKWDLSAQNFVVAFYSTRGGWTPNAATMTLNPGEGALVQNPLSTGLPVTFIGNVPQGIQVNAGVPTGAGQTAFLSSIVPESAGLDVLGFQPASGDVVYRYNPALHQYSPPYTYNGTSWSPSVPAMNVGEGFYFIRGAASSVSWTENITVTPH